MAGDPQYCLRLSLFMESAHNIWHMEKGRAVKRMKAVPLDVVVRSHWSMSLMGAKYFGIFVHDGINVFLEKFCKNYFLKEQIVQKNCFCYISEHWQCQKFLQRSTQCFAPLLLQTEENPMCPKALFLPVHRFWPHK